MERLVTVGTIQLPATVRRLPPLQRRDENVRVALDFLRQAGEAGCDIVCLPEVFNCWGVPGAEYALCAERLVLTPSTGSALTSNQAGGVAPAARPELDAAAPAVVALAEAAAHWRMYVLAPVVVLVDGQLRNTAVLIDREGCITGLYHKVHLTTPERELGFVAGADYPVFPCDFGRVGVMTCFDVCFPEAARILALGGAEILFFPHMQSFYGEVNWEITVRSRAIDNAVYVVSANYGYGPGEPWMPGMILGRSNIIGPDGIVLADAGRGIGLVTARIDLDQPRLVRCFGVAGDADFRAEMLRHRQPQTYGRIAEPGGGGVMPERPSKGARDDHAGRPAATAK